jgi:hypothetical protein
MTGVIVAQQWETVDFDVSIVILFPGIGNFITTFKIIADVIYPEPVQCTPHQATYLFQDPFHIIVPSTSCSLTRTLSFRYFD